MLKEFQCPQENNTTKDTYELQLYLEKKKTKMSYHFIAVKPEDRQKKT